MNTMTAVENPADFLKDLQEKSKKVSKTILELHQKILDVVKGYQACGEVILFCRDGLLIKASDYHYNGVFFIRSVKIIVTSWCNNCSELCVCFDIGGKEEWRCELGSLGMRVEEGGRGNYGVISRGARGLSTAGFYFSHHYTENDEITTDKFSEFEKLEDIIYQGLTKLKISFLKVKRKK